MNMNDIIGKACNFDIYNDNGLLLLPKYTKITNEHIEWLDQHQIKLTDDDVINIDTNDYYQIVNDAVEESKDVFDEVRHTMQLPMGYIEESIIPSLSNITVGAHVIDLFISLQAKDDYTYRHNIAVGALASIVGKWLNFTAEEILELSMAGFLHDVGKMRIPESILNKPGSLTDEEFAFMKKHTVFGYDIIKTTSGTTDRQAIVALQHHERMDGTGYPYGLTRNKIDIYSRIVSVVDVFHAMTSRRVYRNEAPFYQVLHEMNAESFGQLDPKITRLFIEKMMLSLIGHDVLLTDGRKANIIMIHKHDPIHPLIRVDDHFIDLSKERLVHIEEVISS